MTAMIVLVTNFCTGMFVAIWTIFSKTAYVLAEKFFMVFLPLMIKASYYTAALILEISSVVYENFCVVTVKVEDKFEYLSPSGIRSCVFMLWALLIAFRFRNRLSGTFFSEIDDKEYAITSSTDAADGVKNSSSLRERSSYSQSSVKYDMLRGKATGNDSSVRFRGKTKSNEEKGPENNDGTEDKVFDDQKKYEQYSYNYGDGPEECATTGLGYFDKGFDDQKKYEQYSYNYGDGPEECATTAFGYFDKVFDDQKKYEQYSYNYGDGPEECATTGFGYFGKGFDDQKKYEQYSYNYGDGPEECSTTGFGYFDKVFDDQKKYEQHSYNYGDGPEEGATTGFGYFDKVFDDQKKHEQYSYNYGEGPEECATTGLGYFEHIHSDNPDAPICAEFILGKCKNGSKCAGHHCFLPYQWQYSDAGEWKSLNYKDNERLEKLYCDVTLEEFSPMVVRRSNFRKVKITQKDFERFGQLRRLCTESYVNSTNPLATEWIWYWKREDGRWRKYGQDDTGKDLQEPLEKSFLDEKNYFRFRIADENYILRFDPWGDMRQENVTYRTIKKVRRRPAKFLSIEDISQLIRSQNEVIVSNHQGKYTRGGYTPSHWAPMPSTMLYQRVPLSRRSDEFKEVKKLFKKSIERSVRIIGIERVQNPFMWEKYQRKKENMAAAKTGSHKGRFVSERQLFHGTSPEIVEAICKQNFDWRLYGKNATRYGKGSYFALNSSYSDIYAKKDSERSKFMFVAKVLVGSYTAGYYSYRRPPPKDPSNPSSDLYDSCVDDTSCPTIFVVFDTDQSYPEYIIEYSTSQGSY